MSPDELQRAVLDMATSMLATVQNPAELEALARITDAALRTDMQREAQRAKLGGGDAHEVLRALLRADPEARAIAREELEACSRP